MHRSQRKLATTHGSRHPRACMHSVHGGPLCGLQSKALRGRAATAWALLGVPRIAAVDPLRAADPKAVWAPVPARLLRPLAGAATVDAQGVRCRTESPWLTNMVSTFPANP